MAREDWRLRRRDRAHDVPTQASNTYEPRGDATPDRLPDAEILAGLDWLVVCDGLGSATCEAPATYMLSGFCPACKRWQHCYVCGNHLARIHLAHMIRDPDCGDRSPGDEWFFQEAAL